MTTTWSEVDALRLLAERGVPVVPWRHVDSREAAQLAAAELGLPVVVKLVSSDVAHKSEIGGVVLDVRDLGAVGVAFGGRGRLARTLDDVRAAAQDWAAHRGVMVLDARISRNVITIPYRRLHYGKDE
jgi:acyl-CoA synthetase (NDP forming)